jgi:hypothetical protein
MSLSLIQMKTKELKELEDLKELLYQTTNPSVLAPASALTAWLGPGAQLSGEWRRADGRRFAARHSQKQGVLYLAEMDENDEGVYVCEVKDTRGNVVYELEKVINLISPPRITLNPSRQMVNPGDSPLITCSATGQQPINIIWSREDGAGLPRSVSQDRGRLQFRGISVRDQGRYICTATSSDGSSVATAEVIVNGIQPLRRKLTVFVEPSTPRVVENGSLDINCKITGAESGSVQFTWSKVGSDELPRNARAIGNLIRFMNLSGENDGLYRCTAETELGIFYYDFPLSVQRRGQGTGYRRYP